MNTPLVLVIPACSATETSYNTVISPEIIRERERELLIKALLVAQINQGICYSHPASIKTLTGLKKNTIVSICHS